MPTNPQISVKLMIWFKHMSIFCKLPPKIRKQLQYITLKTRIFGFFLFCNLKTMRTFWMHVKIPKVIIMCWKKNNDTHNPFSFMFYVWGLKSATHASFQKLYSIFHIAMFSSCSATFFLWTPFFLLLRLLRHAHCMSNP